MNNAVPDYLSWFSLQEPPFRLSPDLDFFYPAKPHREAFEVLKYAISRGEGFMVLFGHAGTGKTLLLRLLMNELPKEKKTAFIVTPSVSPRGLLLLLLEELGISSPSDTEELALLLKKFQDTLLNLASKNEKLLIIIDEAQDLPIETIEQLRLLSNIETNKEKLLQILLVGQPELQNLLADPRLCQLTQRIVINETLRPLSLDETKDYVHFRLSRAGRADLQISNSFFSKLYEYSKGLPRLINRLMDRALLMAAASGDYNLLPKHIDSAITTFPEPKSFYTEPDSNQNHPLIKWKNYIGVSLISIGITAFIMFLIAKNPCHKPNISATNNIHTSSLQKNTSFYISIKTPTAIIYSKPLKNSEILSIAKKGEKFLAIANRNKWYLVKTINKKTDCISGWILKEVAERISSEDITLWEKRMDTESK